MDRRALFLALVLGSQALLPLHYYLGADKLDERFAWRMFSPVRMLTCQVDYRVDGQPVSLGEHFHSGWISLVKRGRMDVTRAVGARVCLVNPDRTVTLRYRCRGVDGRWSELLDGSEPVCE